MKPDSAEELDSLAGEYVLGTLSPEQHAAMAERLSPIRPARRRGCLGGTLAGADRAGYPAAECPPVGRIQRSLTSWPATGTRLRWQRLGLWQGLSAAGLAASCCWRLPC
jgi:anti-sigma-K factor RskA